MQAGNLKVSLKQQRQSELRHLTEIAVGIAREEYDAAIRDRSSEQIAKKLDAERISKLRYGNGDYFWINDLVPRMIMHAAKPELNGQDLTEIKDPLGKHLFVAFVDTVKKDGSGFVEYQWPKPGKDAPQPKLSFVAGFAPWGWVIGTGVYIDDLDAQLWDSVRTVIMAVLAVIGVLGVVTLIIARKMSTALVAMSSAVTRLGEGDFAIVLPGLGRRDDSATWRDPSSGSRSRSPKRSRPTQLSTTSDGCSQNRPSGQLWSRWPIPSNAKPRPRSARYRPGPNRWPARPSS